MPEDKLRNQRHTGLREHEVEFFSVRPVGVTQGTVLRAPAPV